MSEYICWKDSTVPLDEYKFIVHKLHLKVNVKIL